MVFQAGSDIARRLISKRVNRKSLSFAVPSPAAPCEPLPRRDTDKVSYKISLIKYIIETELTGENPSPWQAALYLIQVSLCIHLGPNSGGRLA